MHFPLNCISLNFHQVSPYIRLFSSLALFLFKLIMLQKSFVIYNYYITLYIIHNYIYHLCYLYSFFNLFIFI